MHQFQDPNLFSYNPSLDDESNSIIFDDNALFQSLSSIPDQISYYDNQSSNSVPQMNLNHNIGYQNLKATSFTLDNPLYNSTELLDAVSRINIDERRPTLQRQSLSLEIQPCISITEPTPVQPSIRFVDNFIAAHESKLEEEEQPDIINRIMDDFNIDDLLMAQPGTTDWLSWTPIGSHSPASSLEEYYSPQFSIDGRHISRPLSVGDISPQLSLDDLSFSLDDFQNINNNSNNNNNNNSLAVKKDKRARRVSEPPMISFTLQQESLKPVRRSKSDGRRQRSNSSASLTGNHMCLHPGCGKVFTRSYNLTSHMKTHTAERPFACSQCGRRFARQHDRNRHEKLHWGVKPYACVFCSKPFARMDALNRHLRVENGCQSKSQS